MNRRAANRAEKSAGGRKRNDKGQYLPKAPVVKTPETAMRGSEKPLRPRQCRGYLRRELAGSFRAIVSGFVKQAESGSVQHLKLANELLGEVPEPKRRKSSALLLLETLGIEDERPGGAEEKP